MNSKVILILFSELERDLINLRTKEALASKKGQKQILGYGLSTRKIAKVLGYTNHISLNTYVKKRNLRN